MPDNTPGLDGIAKGDLKILSPKCLTLIARLLNLIEAGAPWPSLVRKARTTFISKGEEDLEPSGFRGLAILSKNYRLWAATRMLDAPPCVSLHKTDTRTLERIVSLCHASDLPTRCAAP